MEKIFLVWGMHERTQRYVAQVHLGITDFAHGLTTILEVKSNCLRSTTWEGVFQEKHASPLPANPSIPINGLR